MTTAAWLPSGYRSPVRRSVNEPLRPVNLPDLSAPRPVGRELDAAKDRVAATSYEGANVDMGSGTFSAPGAGDALGAEEEPAWKAGDRVTPSPLRRRDRRQQPDREGRRGSDRRLHRRGREAPDRGVRRAGARFLMAETDALIADLAA